MIPTMAYVFQPQPAAVAMNPHEMGHRCEGCLSNASLMV